MLNNKISTYVRNYCHHPLFHIHLEFFNFSGQNFADKMEIVLKNLRAEFPKKKSSWIHLLKINDFISLFSFKWGIENEC